MSLYSTTVSISSIFATTVFTFCIFVATTSILSLLLAAITTASIPFATVVILTALPSTLCNTSSISYTFVTLSILDPTACITPRFSATASISVRYANILAISPIPFATSTISSAIPATVCITTTFSAAIPNESVSNASATSVISSILSATFFTVSYAVLSICLDTSILGTTRLLVLLII